MPFKIYGLKISFVHFNSAYATISAKRNTLLINHYVKRTTFGAIEFQQK